MKIFATGEKAARQPSYVVSVAPAADELFRQKFPGEVPVDWVTDENVPTQINIEFNWGVAEVSDALGRYMLTMGYAKSTSLVLPTDGSVAPAIDYSLFG